MNIALCFCVRDCEQYLHNIFDNIELVKTLNISVFSIFVYDNCSNKLCECILKEYQKKNKDNVIIRNIINTDPRRTLRIAKARNECLKIVYSELNNISYHFMIDCDDKCSMKWNIDLIDKYLNNFDDDNWDCISFNRNEYYDIWALMFDDFNHHCRGYGEESIRVTYIMKESIINKLKTCKTNSIEVISAFNGFCIYKTEQFRGLYYDGFYPNLKKMISSEEIMKTLLKFKNEYNMYVSMYNTEECCEHLFYHLSAHKKGCKIKISKLKIMQQDYDQDMVQVIDQAVVQ